MPFDAVWVGDWRGGVLSEILKDFKYHSVRAAKDALVDVLDAIIPCLGGEVVVVPLPTIRRHVRIRGVDHTLKMATGLAQRRGWKVEQLVGRAENTVQVGMDAEQRERQARMAYRVEGVIDKRKTYLLLDDVWTTGASMRAAGKLMRGAGVEKMAAVVLVASREK